MVCEVNGFDPTFQGMRPKMEVVYHMDFFHLDVVDAETAYTGLPSNAIHYQYLLGRHVR
tara:strand:- start:194 stop:370 length:177 start_codon:yes stop_codon:yes gene_type:complete